MATSTLNINTTVALDSQSWAWLQHHIQEVSVALYSTGRKATLFNSSLWAAKHTCQVDGVGKDVCHWHLCMLQRLQYGIVGEEAVAGLDDCDLATVVLSATPQCSRQKFAKCWSCCVTNPANKQPDMQSCNMHSNQHLHC